MLLYQLEPGTYFRFNYPSASQRYRNLKVLRTSESSVTISGEIKYFDSWKSLGNSYTIGSDIDVEIVDKSFYKDSIASKEHKIAIVRDKNYVPGKRGRKPNPNKVVVVRDPNYVPGKRGRKAKEIEELEIPSAKEFTIKDVLKINHGSNYNDVVKYMKVVLKDRCKLMRSESLGRGKATNFYKIVK